MFFIVDIYLHLGLPAAVAHPVGVVHVLTHRAVSSRGDRIPRGYRVRRIVDIHAGHAGGDRGGTVTQGGGQAGVGVSPRVQLLH